MSYGAYGFDLGTQVAGADLSTKLFYAAKITASGVIVTDSAGEACDGFLQNDPLQGSEVSLRVEGVTEAVASAAIAKGVLCSVTADGKLKAAASGEYIVGRVLEATGADGDITSLLILRAGRVA